MQDEKKVNGMAMSDEEMDKVSGGVSYHEDTPVKAPEEGIEGVQFAKKSKIPEKIKWIPKK